MKIEDISSNQASNIKVITSNQTTEEEKPFKFSPIDELEIKIDPKSPEDIPQLTMILQNILVYPSTELAQFHHDAMRLGNFDMQSQSKNAHGSQKMIALSKIGERAKMCSCCGFKRQEEHIKMCTSFDEISNMGTSTYLFFVTFKNLSILLAVMTAVYSIYSLITNIVAAKNNAQGSAYTVDYLTISLSSKQVNQSSLNKLFYFIQAWLGMIMVIIWLVIFFVNRYREVKQARQYDNDTISASDYTIAMVGMPLDVTMEEIQASFTEYYNNINSSMQIPESRKRFLKVMNLNIGKPFYVNQDDFKDKELQDIQKEIQQIKQKLREWIRQRQQRFTFSIEKSKREETYKRLSQLMKRRGEKYLQFREKLSKKLRENNTDQLTTIFVTFQTNIARNFVLHFNELTFFSRLKAICGDKNKYHLRRGETVFAPIIQKAPEPEDIIWSNIGRSQCNTNMRKVFTYTVTAILLGLCFMIVYFLSKAQQDQGNNRLISIAISIVISVVNIILGQVIKFLTLFEKDYTSTNRMASLALKSIAAQMINSILIPVITAYYIKTSTGVYQTGGLVDNIFMLAITNSLLPPILIFFDPFSFIVKAIRCLKSMTGRKLYQTQKQHNILYQGIQFEVGYQYIYLVNLFLFVCFFVSLQPIISVIALIGYLLMYWVQKYCLFYRYKRPVPGTDFVNKAVYQMIFLGPLIYSLGSLTWANFDPTGIPQQALLPNILSAVFSSIIIIVPINVIIENCCIDQNAVVKATLYEDDRMFFPSQYDRLNPSTSTEGIEKYQKFMKEKNVEISKKSKQEQERIQQKKMSHLRRAVLNQANIVNPFALGPSMAPQTNINMALQFASQISPQPQQQQQQQIHQQYNNIPQQGPRGNYPQQQQMANMFMPNQGMPMPMMGGAYNPYGFQQPSYSPYGQQYGFGGYGW